jgi:cation diffusion facilitator CzcD-associated flavoprotein CzcO
MLNQDVVWAVVGAGPAGILAVGRLLDRGVAPDEIIWLDPEFNVGDFGQYWLAVPSNTRVALFNQFLHSTTAFQYDKCPAAFSLAHLHENDTCLLGEMAKSLQWVTAHLCEVVPHQTCVVRFLQHSNNAWHLTTTAGDVFSKNVILATGCLPKKLHYDIETQELPLTVALNPALLKNTLKPSNHVVVFGSSHSGILVLKNCLEAGCRVTNFYRSPLRYAIHQEDHTIYDNTGLKGSAASWAKENLHGQENFSSQLTRRCLNDCSEEEVISTLQACDHVVYAVGFAPRHLPSRDLDCSHYDAHTGIIAPGLFGLGVAYPEAMTDRYNITEFNVGLFKFSTYLSKVLPLWMQYVN